ncbi:type IX secretion system protein PorQ [soil metagenome]
MRRLYTGLQTCFVLRPTNRLFFLAVVLFMLPLSMVAQVIGGNSVYDFINLPSSARVTGAGGNLITVRDADISLAYHNPALLNYKMHNRAVMSVTPYMAGIKVGYLGYARHFDSIATTFHAGLQFISYGTFLGRDETGADIGNFGAGEFALTVGAARQWDRYSYGANMKLIYSDLENYKSVGTAFDFAAAYDDTAKRFTATLLLKNVGFQFTPYHDGPREPLPLDLQIGFSKRLKYVPFRISVVAHNLTKWNILYDDPDLVSNDNSLFGDTAQKDNKAGKFFDNAARHIILGGELYLGKALWINFGYNHQRRAELAATVRPGMAGFSFGLGINIKQFSFSLGRARYHAKQASTQITVGVNIHQLQKKNRPPKKVSDTSPPVSSPTPEN